MLWTSSSIGDAVFEETPTGPDHVRRDEKPQFVDEALGQQVLGQGMLP